MDPIAAATIDVAEAAYDLRLSPEEWLPNLLERGAPLFDHGLGCAAAIWAGEAENHRPLVAQMSAGGGRPELAPSFASAIRGAGPEMRRWRAEHGEAQVVSESELERPNLLWVFEKGLGCQDVLGVWAIDLDFHGVGLGIPSSERISLTREARTRWQRIASHIEAGHRLRRRLGCAVGSRAAAIADVPSQAEAVIDPRGFEIAHAQGKATSPEAREALRQAAIRIDRAKGRQGRDDADQALEVWHGLVRGRWSVVDWFDSDGRRLIVAIPNGPGAADPRGLTERELQVAGLAAAGETGKRIAYRLGISRQRVSALLNAAMRKLGVRTQAELVMKLHGFEVAEPSINR